MRSNLTDCLNSIARMECSGAAALLFTRKSSKSQVSELPDYRIYKLTVGDIVREGGKGILLSALVSYTFYKSLAVFAVLAPVSAALFPAVQRSNLKNKRLWSLTLQFKEAIWILSGYLSAGMSLENAFAAAIPELRRMYGNDAMITKEFGLIVRGLKLNKTPEYMLGDFAARSGLNDIRNFAEVFAIAKRSGGSMKEIIERTCSVIRDKTAVSEEIMNMTASRRYEQNIMNVLPFGIIIYINMTSGGFLEIMYTSLTGRCVMTVCMLMLGASYFAAQKILDIRV